MNAMLASQHEDDGIKDEIIVLWSGISNINEDSLVKTVFIR
jgi:hypothetical protein